MRPTPAVLAALALAAFPASALAANDIASISIGAGGVCVTVPSATPKVAFALRATPTGRAIANVSVPVAANDCGGGAGQGHATADFHLAAYPAGGTVVATPQGGAARTFPLPFAAYDRPGAAASGTVHLRNLPHGVLVRGGSPPVIAASSNGRWDSATVSSPETQAASAGNLQPGNIPFAFTMLPERFFVDAQSSYTRIYGAPPGTPITVAWRAKGATHPAATLRVVRSIGANDVEARPGRTVAPGDTVTVTIPGWPTHTVRVGGLTISRTAIRATTPAGTTATLDGSVRFATGAPPCGELGPAASTPCGAASARYVVTQPGLVTAGDSATLDGTEPDGDRYGVRAHLPGATGSIVDGTLLVYGKRDGTVDARYRAPRPAPRPPATGTVHTLTVFDGEAILAGAYEVNVHSAPPLVITPGTTVALSGTARPPASFRFAVTARLVGDSVRGTAWPHGRVLVEIERSGNRTRLLRTATGAGTYAASFPHLQTGDSVTVTGADPKTGNVATANVVQGIAAPVIRGVVDGQRVHGTIHLRATGAGIQSLLWAGDLPITPVARTPFAAAFDTRRLPNGPTRISALALGGLSSYLYVTVAN